MKTWTPEPGIILDHLPSTGLGLTKNHVSPSLVVLAQAGAGSYFGLSWGEFGFLPRLEYCSQDWFVSPSAFGPELSASWVIQATKTRRETKLINKTEEELQNLN